jgi:hypothetical protein
MATDGVSLYFNPQFVETLSAAEIAGTLDHEVMHPALQHHTRRGGRNPRRWNMACDYAINPTLLDAGLTLPKDVLLDNRFRGMSAERIYNLLEEDEQNQSSSSDADTEIRGDPDESGGGSNRSESSSGEGDMDDPHAPRTPAESGRSWMLRSRRAAKRAQSPSRRATGRSLSSRQRTLRSWRESTCRSHAQPLGIKSSPQ